MFVISTEWRLRELRPAAGAVLMTLALQACGGGGGNGMPAGPPTVTISVSPTTITAGQSATLTWSSTMAVSCTASGGWSGTQQLMGSQMVTPTASGAIAYTLTCTGAAGGGGGYGGGGGAAQTAAQTVTLTVNPVTPPPPTAFVLKALVADGAGAATTQDKNLVNAWGLVFAPNDPVWIANNATNTSTLYDGNGTIENLVVTLPADATNSAPFQPTGIVVAAPLRPNYLKKEE